MPFITNLRQDPFERFEQMDMTQGAPATSASSLQKAGVDGV
jgi:hypothetical protein